MYLQHLDLAMQYAQQRVASLLEETEHDRLASRARAANAARLQRRRLSLTARAQPRQPVHEHAGAR
jgi:hypothetical protein